MSKTFKSSKTKYDFTPLVEKIVTAFKEDNNLGLKAITPRFTHSLNTDFYNENHLEIGLEPQEFYRLAYIETCKALAKEKQMVSLMHLGNLYLGDNGLYIDELLPYSPKEENPNIVFIPVITDDSNTASAFFMHLGSDKKDYILGFTDVSLLKSYYSVKNKEDKDNEFLAYYCFDLNHSKAKDGIYSLKAQDEVFAYGICLEDFKKQVKEDLLFCKEEDVVISNGEIQEVSSSENMALYVTYSTVTNLYLGRKEESTHLVDELEAIKLKVEEQYINERLGEDEKQLPVSSFLSIKQQGDHYLQYYIVTRLPLNNISLCPNFVIEDFLREAHFSSTEGDLYYRIDTFVKDNIFVFLKCLKKYSEDISCIGGESLSVLSYPNTTNYIAKEVALYLKTNGPVIRLGEKVFHYIDHTRYPLIARGEDFPDSRLIEFPKSLSVKSTKVHLRYLTEEEKNSLIEQSKVNGEYVYFSTGEVYVGGLTSDIDREDTLRLSELTKQDNVRAYQAIFFGQGDYQILNKSIGHLPKFKKTDSPLSQFVPVIGKYFACPLYKNTVGPEELNEVLNSTLTDGKGQYYQAVLLKASTDISKKFYPNVVLA